MKQSVHLWPPELTSNLHWFCNKFKSLAMESIFNDKDLEEKINRHIKVVIDKILEIDRMMTEKNRQEGI